MKAINDNFIDILINDPLYDIRADGSIWTLQPKSGPLPHDLSKLIWRQLDREQNGYRIATYCGKFLKVHRILYRKFIGPLNPSLDINHKDGNKLNNNLDNLELITNLENLEHANVTGLIPMGENAINAVLTNVEVIEIKKYLKLGYKGVDLAKKYGVGKYLISNIKQGKTWKHIIV